jgi:hypothetical protein
MMVTRAMISVMAHPAGQFIAGKNTVIIGIHAGEHGDKPGAELVSRYGAVAIAVEPVKTNPVMRQDFILRQGTVTIRVKRGGAEHMAALVVVTEISGDGETGDNHP